MQTVIFLEGKPVTLNFRGFEDQIDVDQLLEIDHSNLYGEAVTIAALYNHIGILKAEVEKVFAIKKMELETSDSELKQALRKTAAETAQKITEAGLQEMVEIEKIHKLKKKALIDAQFNVSIIDSMFWSVSAKNKKLDNLIKAVTPLELYQELQDGVINNILIKKRRSITDPK
jgi:hypothetical protein